MMLPKKNGDCKLLLHDYRAMYVGFAMIMLVSVAKAQVDTTDTPWSEAFLGPTPTIGLIHALAYTNNTLYVGGAFGAVKSLRYGAGAIAAYDLSDSTWDTLAGGVDGAINCLLTVGDSLFVGGSFTVAGDTAALSVAMWTNGGWHPLGDGIQGNVYDLYYRDGTLYAAGSFDTAGGISARNVARACPVLS